MALGKMLAIGKQIWIQSTGSSIQAARSSMACRPLLVAALSRSTPQFGEVCFDPEGANPGDGCQDLATGNGTPPARETGQPVQSGIGQASLPGAPNAAPASDLAAGGIAAASSAGIESVTVGEAPAAATPELAEEAAQPDVRHPGGHLNATAGSPGARAGMIMGAEHQAHNGNSMILGGENLAHLGVELAEQQPQNSVELAEEQAQNDGGAETAEEQPQASDGGEPEFTDTANPAPTIDNGLPGATGFVPDNIDGGIGQNGVRRYFEVTLNQAGTTTLSSAVTIDKLNVTGAAGLNVAGAGNLTSLIDINQTGGMTNVDGALTTNGDYLLALGILSGTGTVTTPFLTSVAGMIAPGTMGTIGTLNVNGNVVMSSGSTLLIDVGASGNSDVLAITGDVSLGGNVAFAPVSGFSSIGSSNYTILTNTGTQTGTFNSSQFGASAILNATFTYNANSVDVVIQPGTYSSVVDGTNAVQVSYASLMDQNRGNPALVGLFQTLDFADAATIQAVFDSWAPTTESAVQNMARSSLNDAGRFYRNRLSGASRSSSGGTVAVIGRPIELAAASSSGYNIPGSSAVMNDAAVSSAAATQVTEGGVNEDMAVYLAGGFIEGNGAGMPVANPK